MFKTPSQTRGFSLIEMLVYMAILVMVGIAVVTSFFSLREVFERHRVLREVNAAATTVLDRFVREAREAEAVDAGSILGVSPGTLMLTAGATTTTFSLSDGGVTIEKTGAAAGALTPENVTVDSLRFFHYGSETSGAVRVAMTLSVEGRFASTTKTFYTTAVLRGIYEE